MAKKQQDAAPNPNEELARENDFATLSDAELGTLTDEERNSLKASPEGEEGDDEGTGSDADEKSGGEAEEGEQSEDESTGSDEGDEGEEAEEGDDAGEGEEAEEGAAAKGEGEESEEAEETEDAYAGPDPLDDLMPAVPQWGLPENADETVKGLDTKERELAQKFDDGDMNASEFHQQMSQINAERAQINEQISKARMAHEMRMSAFTQRVVPRFLSEHPMYKNETALEALDGAVRRLQVESADPFDPRILRKAHDSIVKAFGVKDEGAVSPKPAAKKVAPKPAGKKGAEPPSKEDKPGVPPTLARVPADEIDSADGGKFARLERLERRDPDAFQEALGKLSPAEQDQYLAGA